MNCVLQHLWGAISPQLIHIGRKLTEHVAQDPRRRFDISIDSKGLFESVELLETLLKCRTKWFIELVTVLTSGPSRVTTENHSALVQSLAALGEELSVEDA